MQNLLEAAERYQCIAARASKRAHERCINYRSKHEARKLRRLERVQAKVTDLQHPQELLTTMPGIAAGEAKPVGQWQETNDEEQMDWEQANSRLQEPRGHDVGEDLVIGEEGKVYNKQQRNSSVLQKEHAKQPLHGTQIEAVIVKLSKITGNEDGVSKNAPEVTGTERCEDIVIRAETLREANVKRTQDVCRGAQEQGAISRREADHTVTNAARERKSEIAAAPRSEHQRQGTGIDCESLILIVRST